MFSLPILFGSLFHGIAFCAREISPFDRRSRSSEEPLGCGVGLRVYPLQKNDESIAVEKTAQNASSRLMKEHLTLPKTTKPRQTTEKHQLGVCRCLVQHRQFLRAKRQGALFFLVPGNLIT